MKEERAPRERLVIGDHPHAPEIPYKQKANTMPPKPEVQESEYRDLQLSRSSLSNPWLDNKLRLAHRSTGLIAYIRITGQPGEFEEQMEKIERHCAAHGYYISKIFLDEGIPSTGLQGAIDSLDEVGGIIAVDLNRFLHYGQSKDRLRELRPFLRHFISHSPKHLITVDEGIDTHSPSGQKTALDLMTDNTDCFFS